MLVCVTLSGCVWQRGMDVLCEMNSLHEFSTAQQMTQVVGVDKQVVDGQKQKRKGVKERGSIKVKCWQQQKSMIVLGMYYVTM